MTNPEMRVPRAQIDVIESGERGRRCDYACRVGQEISIFPDVLGRYCMRDLDPLVDDLVLVAAATAFADRVVARKPSIAWRRSLEVSVPVNCPERWQDPTVYRKLICALDLVTGDTWAFTFKHRRSPTQVRPQAQLELKDDVCTNVMSYSEGLDSFAVARLTIARSPGVPLVLVTTGNHRNRELDKSNSSLNSLMYRVAVPFRLPTKRSKYRHREASYRSRAFVFGAMAGIAAFLLNSRTIYVAESGQGSLGPWLTPIGNEAPDVRMHPLFTKAMSAFLSSLFGISVTHQHPQLWSTKGQTLKELLDKRLEDGWWLTSSCARDQRHVSMDERRIQCGVCAGCLLRRQSLYAAGFNSKLESYLWQDLSASTLEAACIARATKANDVRQSVSRSSRT